MTYLLEVNNLIKSYGTKQVIHGISFKVEKGEILCFLGPNGASKSTTINIICGALSYEGGEILFKGEGVKQNLSKFKEKLGVVPQDLALYEELTAYQNVKFFASLYGLKGQQLKAGIDFALAAVALTSKKDERVKTFSGGMKRRLNIACAIAHRPELVIMDEPTVGIDPQSRNHILSGIKKMREQGMTIFYTTHYMEEVEEISTRIIIMDHGEIIASGTKESLKKARQDKLLEIELAMVDQLQLDPFYQIEGVKQLYLKENTLFIQLIKGVENFDKIISQLLEQKQHISKINVEESNLETVFLDLTGRTLRD